MKVKAKAQGDKIACIILAAGKGTRMRSNLPKVLHQVAKKPMLLHVIDTARTLGAEKIVVVTAPDMKPLRDLVSKHYKDSVENAIQHNQQGTGDAVKSAKAALKDFPDTVLVLYGDTPLMRAETLAKLAGSIKNNPKAAVAVLGMEIHEPNDYGRLVLGKKGELERIVEVKEATAKEKAIKWCNSGVMAVRGKHLFTLLGRVTNKNAKKEYYLTDLVGLARKDGHSCTMVSADPQELLGVNSRAELAVAESILQRRLRAHAMENGATLVDPASVHFCADTKIGQDVIIHPHVVFGPGVEIANNVEIRSFCHIEGARVKAGAIIGPFARLRPGAVVCETAHIGNFVEIKNSTIERGAKANHLSYIGDSHVGEGANIGAGTITANYDGYNKHRTAIGAGASIGSNAVLVAPVTIGDGAMVGAGSVITEDVDADALAIARAPQKQKMQWAKSFRNRKNN